MNHKFFNPFICLVLLIVSISTIAKGSATNTDSAMTRVDNVELKYYRPGVSDDIAHRLVNVLAEEGFDNNLRFYLRDESDSYRLTLPLIEKPNQRMIESSEVAARYYTDRLSLEKPIVYEFTFGNEELVVRPIPPAGTLYMRDSDRLYHSPNMTEAEVEAVAEGLVQIGLFGPNNAGKQTAKVEKTNDEFILSVPTMVPDQLSSTESQQMMQDLAESCMEVMFNGSATKIIACSFTLQPYDGLEWIAKPE